MGLSVLIVDDSMVARLAIKGFIKESVAELAEAPSGEAALELVGKGLRPDMVFLDLTMPGMGGVEALKELKAMVPGLKVTVVTADIQAKTLEEVRAAGAFEVIRKPADKAAVLGALARAGGGGGGTP